MRSRSTFFFFFNRKKNFLARSTLEEIKSTERVFFQAWPFGNFQIKKNPIHRLPIPNVNAASVSIRCEYKLVIEERVAHQPLQLERGHIVYRSLSRKTGISRATESFRTRTTHLYGLPWLALLGVSALCTEIVIGESSTRLCGHSIKWGERVRDRQKKNVFILYLCR